MHPYRRAISNRELLLLVACGAIVAGAWMYVTWGNSLYSLGRRLRARCADESLSCHRLLRDATHDVRRVTINRSWRAVESQLRRQGLRQVQESDSGSSARYRYVVPDQGWYDAAGRVWTLYLDFTVTQSRTGTFLNGRQPLVVAASAGLLLKPNGLYSQELAAGGYPEDSILSHGLRTPDVSDAARKYPIIKEIDIRYDYLQNRWIRNSAQGFYLALTIGDSPQNDLRGARFQMTAQSNLDPEHSWQNSWLLPPFIGEDTIGDLSCHGSQTWPFEPEK
jgi:hypothetical protein